MFKLIRENTSLIAVSWGHFVNDFFMSTIPVVLFAFAIALELNAKEMALVAFVITTAGTFFQPLVGWIIDKVKKSGLLLIALLGITIGMSLAGLITNYYILLVVVGISALGSSIYHPLGSTITIHKTSLSRGKSLSIFMTVGSFAHSAAPIVAIPLVQKFGLKGLTFLLIPGLLSVLLLYLTKVHKVTWEKKDHDKQTKEKMTINQKLHILIPMLIAIGKGLLYRVVVVFGVVILGLKGAEPILAGAILFGFMITRATSTLVGGFVSDYIGEKKTLMFFNTIAVFAVICLVYGNVLVTAIGLLVLGFTLNGTSAANITITHKIMPNNINYGTGLIMGFSATLSAVAMLLYGGSVDLIGHLDSLKILLIIVIGIMTLSYMIPNKYTSKS